MSNYAIIETGSKQYRVEPKSVIEIEKLEIPEGQKEVTLDRVLLIRNGDEIQVGTPHLKGASVICDYLGNTKADKVISFRFRRRKNSRRRQGHRQQLTKLIIKEIRSGN